MLYKYRYPLIMLAFFIIGCLFFHDYLSSVFIDIPREFLIPKAILEGELLYKDILNIYGALPYYIAALFVKTFGFKISTFFAMNAINALFFICGIYFLAREFLTKKYSCIISLCILFITVFNIYLFNFIFPYSICYTFGLCAYVYSTLFLVKFVKTQSKYNYLYISSLFASFAIACKNEFIFLPLVFLIVFVINRKKYDYRIFYSVLFLFVFLLIQLFVLLLNGLSIQDLLNAIDVIKRSALTPAMTEFHRTVGMLPDFSLVKISIILFCWLCVFMTYKLYKCNKIVGIMVFCILFAVLNFFPLGRNMLFFLPVLCLIFICLNIRKYIKRQDILVLSFCALFSSLKCFYFLSFCAYGTYCATILFIFFATVLVHIRKKDIIKIFFLFSFIFFLSSCCYKICGTHRIEYNDFKFSVKNKEAIVFNSIKNWIEKNANKDDEILIFPEGLIFYVIQDRKADYMLYSLHNIFLQTFGDKYVKNRILNSNIKYLIDVGEYDNAATALTGEFVKKRYLEELLKEKIKKIDNPLILIGNSLIKIHIYKKEAL